MNKQSIPCDSLGEGFERAGSQLSCGLHISVEISSKKSDPLATSMRLQTWL